MPPDEGGLFVLLLLLVKEVKEAFDQYAHWD